MKLELKPSPLMKAFYVPAVVVDCGTPRDIEVAACNAFLLWASEYPDYTPWLAVPGRPKEEAALNGALFCMDQP